MTTRAFQKVYTKIDNITKATITLRATGVGNDELATVGGKLAQVVKIMGENVTLQVFAGTEGLATDSEVVFHGEAPKLRVSDNLAGRFFNAYGEPLEGGEPIEGEEREIGGPTVNPFRRIQPSELIATGIAGIDLTARCTVNTYIFYIGHCSLFTLRGNYRPCSFRPPQFFSAPLSPFHHQVQRGACLSQAKC